MSSLITSKGILLGFGHIETTTAIVVDFLENEFTAGALLNYEKNMITQELVMSLFTYNSETGYLNRKNTSGGRLAGERVGYVELNGYRRLRIKGRQYAEHRIIWLLTFGNLPNVQIDHINRVRNDNRIINLRLANASQNQQNIRIKRNNTTGICGVSYHKQAKKFTSSIVVDGKQIFLGLFKDIECAALARKDAESTYFTHSPK